MTRKQTLNQSGIAHIIIIIIIALVLGASTYAIFRMTQEKDSAYTAENSEAKATASPVKIKSLPIQIAKYDPKTGKAGDITFPEGGFSEQAFDLIFFDYGQVLQGQNVAGGIDKTNPQPSFRTTAGANIHALIDGEVVEIPKLYSNDYSIHMRGKGSDLIFETEHVQNVKVKVGDKVTAGTVIAQASDYDSSKIKGLGLVEIGVLYSGKAPTHVCTFDFLDDSIKADSLKKIDQLKKDWAEFRSKPELYTKTVTPGCVDRTPITDNNNAQTGTTNN